VVLGQESHAVIVAPSAPTASNFSIAEGIYSNGTWLAVSDYAYNRVLIWDTIPTTNNAAADRVLGQSSFTSVTAGTSSTTLSGPTGLGGEGDWLAVADNGNHRVLLYDMSPLPATGGGASFVVGQASFSGNTPSGGAAGLEAPSGVAIHGNALFVADTGNQRVQIFAAVPSSNGASATTALFGGTETFNGPFGVAVVGTKLYVASAYHNRILAWNTIPVEDISPDFVLGQADFTGILANRGAGAPSASTLDFPVSLAADGGKLFVIDGSNNRVLIWNAAPAASGAPADVVVGQRQFTTKDDLLKDDVNAYELRMPGGVAVAADGTLFVADSDHHRVLRFNGVPQADGASAVAALGQPNLSTAVSPGSATATVLKKPRDVLVHGDRLLVADTDFHRVVGWSALPSASGAAADFVLGATSPNATPAYSSSAIAFRKPNHLAVGGSRLYMTEQQNNRALIFSAVPTTSNTPASAALAQPNLTASTPNNAGGSPSASSLYDPTATSTNGTVLAIADTTNNRILIWNALPSTTDEPANVVLGQAAFSTDGTNAPGSATASSLRSPKGVLVQGSKIFVADTGNHRVLIWDTIPTTHGQLPDRVWGQPDFTSDTPNNGGLSALSLAGPTKIETDGVRVFIADEQNLRIVIRPLD